LAFFSLILLISLAISALAFFIEFVNVFDFSVRLFALNGFLALSVATVTTAFLREITLFLKKPFLRIHHYFAAAGLVLITLHPIALAIQTASAAVFLPNLESPYLFLFYGGRQALIIIYIALAAVLIRKKIFAYWRTFHALMYVALFFGIIHANFSGSDFLQNIFIMITFNALFAITIIAFGLKRLRIYRMKEKRKKEAQSNA
jgi:predicted ferric reductase